MQPFVAGDAVVVAATSAGAELEIAQVERSRTGQVEDSARRAGERLPLVDIGEEAELLKLGAGFEEFALARAQFGFEEVGFLLFTDE